MKKIKQIINNKYFKYIVWLSVITLLFLGIDVATRYASIQMDRYFDTSCLYPYLFNLFYIGIFITLFMYLNKKWGKIVLLILLIIFNIFSFAELMHMDLLGRFFNIYDLFSVGEGLTYITGILEHFNILSFAIIIMSIIGYILVSYLWPDNKISNRFKIAISIIIMCLGLFGKTSYSYYMGEELIEDTWNSNQEAIKVYNLFSNPTSSFQVSGMYEYIFRDIYMYFNNKDVLNDEEISSINSYLDRDIDSDNSYSGLFNDKNVIMIMMESVDNTFLNSDVMPNLNKLKDESLYFTNRYSPIFGIGATFNAEFTSLTGLYSSTVGKAAYFYPNNDYRYSLVNLFKNSGYSVNSFHMNKGSFYDRSSMHNAFGFEKYNSFYNYVGDYLYSDSEILDYDNIYEDIVKDDKFFSYIITYSAHLPYSNSSYTCSKHFNDKFSSDDEETGCFKSALYDTDLFVGNLIKRLEDDGKLNDTVIILYGDHLAYSYLGRVDNGGNANYDLNKGVYMIYNSDIKGKKVDTINTTIDMTPTIANLFSLKGYDANNYLGVDVFNKDALHIAYFSDYNWYDGDVYSAELTAKDYNKKSKYYNKINTYVSDLINYDNLIVTGNYYKYK